MALNIKRLENLPHPPEKPSGDQVYVEQPGKCAEGSKNYEENINDGKRLSLIRGYIAKLYERKKGVKKQRKDKRKSFNDAIRRLNIL